VLWFFVVEFPSQASLIPDRREEREEMSEGRTIEACGVEQAAIVNASKHSSPGADVHDWERQAREVVASSAAPLLRSLRREKEANGCCESGSDSD
jgi:hypothetical protein